MAAPTKTAKQLRAWLAEQGGIAHRRDILDAGFGLQLLRAFARADDVTTTRRWVHLPGAPDVLVAAARAGGRITCTTLARHKGWWMPDGVPARIHLHLLPKAGSPRLDDDWAGVTHWTQPLAPTGRSLVGSVEDALAHIALCQPRDTALVLWESAVRCETVTPESLRTVAWPTRAARELAEAVQGLSDSGLETLVVAPLRRWGLRVRQQVKLAGRFVDLLVGDRLVIQIDGWEFHSTSGQRARDIAHDAELRLRGYTVLRFSYSQVIHEWPATEATMRRAVASRLHLAA